MGYSEIYCTICGASFNIARVRRQDEPKEAAWASYQRDDSYVDAEAVQYLPDTCGPSCGQGSGCLYYDRGKDVYKSPWEPSGGRVTRSHDKWKEEVKYGQGFEHIAGPGCQHNAYNGHNISAEEMEGCTTFQCFVPKREDWEPASDDEDFERPTDFPVYLSGLCDSMRDREDGAVHDMTPMRHNMRMHIPEDIVEFYTYSDLDYSMPFHPWCLEVYKRASRTKTGHIGMPELVKWNWDDSAVETFGGLYPPKDRADDIACLREQWWNHKAGTEYVAANPLFVPELAEVTQGCIYEDVDGNQGAFDITPNGKADQASPDDNFASLPIELRLNILSHLSSKDIAQLRLASRVFKQLPISLWRDLIVKDMPWLWEARPTEHESHYPFLATTTECKLKNNQTIKHEPVQVPNVLPQAGVNWHKLYCEIKRRMHHGELKGMRNRRRIWMDCTKILDYIESHRQNDE